jgi:Ca2+/H+ antiporter, TMEM165/GDT1 family
MENMHVSKKIAWGILFALLFAAMVLLLGQVVMLLWNYVLPQATGWNAINYKQALALLVLCKILFGGFGGGRRGGRFKDSWKSKWGKMSEEEKQQLKERFKQSCKSN